MLTESALYHLLILLSKKGILFPAGFKPGTCRMLGECDNPYTAET